MMASPTPVFLVDETDRITHWNPAAERLFGWSGEDVAGAPPPIVPANRVSEFQSLLEDARSGQPVAGVDTRAETKTGATVDVALSASPIPGPDGRPTDQVAVFARQQASRENDHAAYEAMLDRVGDMVYVADADGRLQIVNDAAASFVGHPKEALVGEHVSMVLSDESVARGRQLVKELLAADGDEGRTYEMDIVTANGQLIRCENHVTLLPAENGGFRGTVGVVRDIDERKARERELEQFETILETVPVGVLVLDEEAVVEWVNEEFWSTINKTEAEVVDTQFLDLVEEGFVGPELVDDYLDAVRTLLSSEVDAERVMIEFEVDVPSEPGTLDYEGYISLRALEDGEFRGTVNAFLDVTERRERERELKQYKTMMETVPDGVFTLDDRGRMTRVNEAWATTVGYAPEELEGEPFEMLVEEGIVHEEIIGQYLDLVRELLSSETDTDEGTLTTRLVPPGDEEEHIYEATVGLLPYDDSFEGATGVVRDITETVRQREALTRQNERLEAFASIVSHDLRNPLGIARGNVELALETGDLDRLDAVSDAHDRMEAIIDDVLTLARDGESVDDVEIVDLHDIVQTSWSTVDSEQATLGIDDDLPRIRAAPDRVIRLYENLFRNAIEHVGPDVQVVVGTLSDGFYVEDDGPGIPPDERDRVFDRGVSTATDGAGLGLPIVRQIANAHDWTVTVSEGSKGGARFEFTGVDVV